MDPWINSLVQSPLVRSLNTVPSRMSSFAYGVRDNVPPFSFTKEIVDKNDSTSVAWAHTPNDLSGEGPFTFTFNIPESGLLDRMYIRVRMYAPWLVANGAVVPSRLPLEHAGVVLQDNSNVAAVEDLIFQKRYIDAMSSSMNFGCIFESATLTTLSNKTIETLYPTSIAAAVQKMPASQRDFWFQTLTGYAAGPKFTNQSPGAPGTQLVTPFTQLYDPYMELRDANASVTDVDHQNMFADFLIPLPFSLLHQLKDNLQTRFVDDLRVTVTLRKDPVLTQTKVGVADAVVTGYAGFKASLACIYHNFHDVIENSIRDQNFKRGFPASVYCHDHKVESSRLVSGKKLTVRLTNRQLTSEILFQLRQGKGATTRPRYTVPKDMGNIGPFEFILYGSGRPIWRAYSWELSGPDVADYQLADGHAYGEDLAKPCTSVIYTAPIQSSLPFKASHQLLSRVSLGFENLFSVRFGFQANDNFYTGGLALQTISNPYVEIISLGTEDTPWADDKYDMDVILKTCQMLRIDSDTGVITTSLDV